MNQKHKTQETKKPSDKLYCEICECHFSRANKSQHCKTRKHQTAQKFNDYLLILTKSKLITELTI